MDAIEPTIKGWHLKYRSGMGLTLHTIEQALESIRGDVEAGRVWMAEDRKRHGWGRAWLGAPILVPCAHRKSAHGLCYRDDYTPTGPTRGRAIKMRRS